MLDWTWHEEAPPSEGDIVFVRSGELCDPDAGGDNMGQHQVAIAKFSDQQFCDYFLPECWYEPLYWVLVPEEVVAELDRKLPYVASRYLNDRRGVPYPEDADKEPEVPTFASEGYDIPKLLALIRS